MASSLRSNLALLSPHPSTTTHKPRPFLIIRCGPRSNRGPLLKGRVLSIEAIQAVQSLKRAHRGDQSKLNEVLSETLPRLIKADLIAAFKELLRQDHSDLALMVFSVVRSESWYQTNLGIYGDLVLALGKKGMMEDIDRLILDLEGEGMIPCDDKGLGRLAKALIATERTESTVRLYGLMKRSGWGSTFPGYEYVSKVLSRGLRRLGEETIADEIDAEFGGTCGRLGEYEVLKDLKQKPIVAYDSNSLFGL